MLVYGVMTQQYLFVLPVVIIGLVFLASTVLDIRLQRQMVEEKAKSTGSSLADIVERVRYEKEAEYWLGEYEKGNLDSAAREAVVARS